jgi:cell division transport system permease protein
MRDKDTSQKYDPVAEWFINHLRAFFYGFGEIIRSPVASFTTLAVLAITITLPTGLYVILKDFQYVGKHWDNKPSLSIYLKNNAPTQQVELLIDKIKQQPFTDSLKYISAKQGLEEFTKTTKLKDVINAINDNPIPASIIVTMHDFQANEYNIEQLADWAESSPGVDVVQLDTTWIKRMNSIIDITKRFDFALSLLFSIGAILTVSNTIRLILQNHRQEMQILRLIGATKSFIRRPFLYHGFIYGIISGIIAWIIVAILMNWIAEPVSQLAKSYGSYFTLTGLSFGAGLLIIMTAALLGLAGAWLASIRYLRTPEIS